MTGDEEIAVADAKLPTNGGPSRTWTTYSALYWSLLSGLVNRMPAAHVWGKLVVMEYNRVQLELDLDAAAARQVNLYTPSADPDRPGTPDPAPGVLNVDLGSCGARGCPVKKSLDSAGSGIQLRYMSQHGVSVMSGCGADGAAGECTAVHLWHLADTPYATACTIAANKPLVAFNAALFDETCSRFHQGMAACPHADHFTVKLLLHMCVFNISVTRGGAGREETLLAAPLWFIVVNVAALRQVLRESVVRHIIRQELVQWHYSLKGCSSRHRLHRHHARAKHENTRSMWNPTWEEGTSERGRSEATGISRDYNVPVVNHNQHAAAVKFF